LSSITRPYIDDCKLTHYLHFEEVLGFCDDIMSHFRIYTEIPYTSEMATKTEIIWRHLLARTSAGHRRYASVTALAKELDLPVSTTHQALGRPVEIGALTISAVAGLRVLDPVRLLTLYCAHRHLERDVVVRARVDAPVEDAERLVSKESDVILGGFAALIAHTTGVNRIADYNTVLVYADADVVDALPLASDGPCELIVARPDPWLKIYGSLTPAAQAYADVFNLRDWQASRFIHELNPGDVVDGDEQVSIV